jgi:cob(I)alamin adenosyltransferase
MAMTDEPPPAPAEVPKRRGYVHVYTGDGKGKTTAAFGVALRSAGAGHRVFIGQFAKGMHYSELDALKRFDDLIQVRQFGRGQFITGEPTQEDIDAARAGLAEIRAALMGGEYAVVILDEANIATHLKLIGVDELLELVDARREGVEVIITGRRADPRVVKRADLVTEMLNVKHYYDAGVQARVGIEK